MDYLLVIVVLLVIITFCVIVATIIIVQAAGAVSSGVRHVQVLTQKIPEAAQNLLTGLGITTADIAGDVAALSQKGNEIGSGVKRVFKEKACPKIGKDFPEAYSSKVVSKLCKA